MTKLALVAFVWGVLSFSGTAFAEEGAQPAIPADVCSRSAADVQALAYDVSARISFQNQGGLLNGGVCWWHSRLQRSALFLATFRPELARATRGQAVTIINQLARMSRVVEIPGYSNFNDFSRDFEPQILSRLDAWQREDGILGFRWVDGLAGHWHVAPATLTLIMDRIHELVTREHRILFEKLHFNSIASHAYLIIGSRKTEAGYDIDVIDSNDPGATRVVHYTYGQSSLTTAGGGQLFVPYLDYRGDMGRINAALRSYCTPKADEAEL